MSPRNMYCTFVISFICVSSTFVVTIFLLVSLEIAHHFLHFRPLHRLILPNRDPFIETVPTFIFLMMWSVYLIRYDHRLQLESIFFKKEVHFCSIHFCDLWVYWHRIKSLFCLMIHKYCRRFVGWTIFVSNRYIHRSW